MPQSTRASSKKTTTRGSKNFPLWLHTGRNQWCKKIKGHFHYFGTDKDAAFKEYARVKEDLEAGRKPPRKDERSATLQQLCDTFLEFKETTVLSKEMTQRSLHDYIDSAQGFCDYFGKTTPVNQLGPDDLLRYRQHLAEGGKSPHTIGNQVQRCRVILRFAFENKFVDHPIRFGEFKRPKKSAFRRARQEAGSRLFTPEEIWTLLDSADTQMRAMILLGINCGYGNADCGQLPIAAVDLAAGWIEFPRPKTGIDRRCPLWPETVAALAKWLELRREKKDKHQELVFVTKYGQAWHRDGDAVGPLSAEFRKFLKRLKIYRPGLSFYALRHTFQTIADRSRDYLATKLLMGHIDGSISEVYREQFDNAHLSNVTNYVRKWLLEADGGPE